MNFVADVESAIAENEIIAVNSTKLKKENKAAADVQVKQELSVADETAKLKKLYDEGILTKDDLIRLRKNFWKSNKK